LHSNGSMEQWKFYKLLQADYSFVAQISIQVEY
jgi:hypothetical protein